MDTEHEQQQQWWWWEWEGLNRGGRGGEGGADKRVSVGRNRDFQEVKKHWRQADGTRLNLFWDDA